MGTGSRTAGEGSRGEAVSDACRTRLADSVLWQTVWSVPCTRGHGQWACALCSECPGHNGRTPFSSLGWGWCAGPSLSRGHSRAWALCDPVSLPTGQPSPPVPAHVWVCPPPARAHGLWQARPCCHVHGAQQASASVCPSAFPSSACLVALVLPTWPPALPARMLGRLCHVWPWPHVPTHRTQGVDGTCICGLDWAPASLQPGWPDARLSAVHTCGLGQLCVVAGKAPSWLSVGHAAKRHGGTVPAETGSRFTRRTQQGAPASVPPHLARHPAPGRLCTDVSSVVDLSSHVYGGAFCAVALLCVQSGLPSSMPARGGRWGHADATVVGRCVGRPATPPRLAARAVGWLVGTSQREPQAMDGPVLPRETPTGRGGGCVPCQDGYRGSR